MDANKLEQVQSFRARTMREALRAVRNSLGDDALILDTRGDDRLGVEVLAGREAVRADVHVSATTPEKTDFSPQQQVDESPSVTLANPTSQPITERSSDRLQPPSVEAHSANDDAHVNPSRVASPPVARHPVDFDIDETPLADRLASIEAALHSLTRGRHGNGTVVDRLCGRGVPLGIAREVVERAVGRDVLSPPTPQALVRSVAAGIHCEPPPPIHAGQQRRVAFVGPTGVGKTTTLAKIAAKYRLEAHMNVGLITVDDYRVAAADQLQTYAGLLESPVRVVASDDEMEAAVDGLSSCDIILVDTAGFGLAGDERMDVLSRRLDAAHISERYLVLSTVSSLASMRVSAERYARLKPTAAIYTKLDETPEPGVILGMSEEVALPLHYVTAGQEVPHDIDHADSLTLARNVLGQSG